MRYFSLKYTKYSCGKDAFKQWNAMRARFSRHRASAYCVLLNRNTTVFLNRKALSAKALWREKSLTLNAVILTFIKAEDAGVLTHVKDDNAEKWQKIKFKAGWHSVPLLRNSKSFAVCSQRINHYLLYNVCNIVYNTMD